MDSELSTSIQIWPEAIFNHLLVNYLSRTSFGILLKYSHEILTKPAVAALSDAQNIQKGYIMDTAKIQDTHYIPFNNVFTNVQEMKRKDG